MKSPYGRSFACYETIGGGMGARAGSDGPSAIHSHMTNTLDTPVEALEYDYPLRVLRYEIRRGSGGWVNSVEEMESAETSNCSRILKPQYSVSAAVIHLMGCTEARQDNAVRISSSVEMKRSLYPVRVPSNYIRGIY